MVFIFIFQKKCLETTMLLGLIFGLQIIIFWNKNISKSGINIDSLVIHVCSNELNILYITNSITAFILFDYVFFSDQISVETLSVVCHFLRMIT